MQGGLSRAPSAAGTWHRQIKRPTGRVRERVRSRAGGCTSSPPRSSHPVGSEAGDRDLPREEQGLLPLIPKQPPPPVAPAPDCGTSGWAPGPAATSPAVWARNRAMEQCRVLAQPPRCRAAVCSADKGPALLSAPFFFFFLLLNKPSFLLVQLCWSWEVAASSAALESARGGLRLRAGWGSRGDSIPDAQAEGCPGDRPPGSKQNQPIKGAGGAVREQGQVPVPHRVNYPASHREKRLHRVPGLRDRQPRASGWRRHSAAKRLSPRRP